MDPERRLQQAWQANAAAWTEAVRGGRIASRAAATDQAIVEAVLEQHPARVLDVGCGEGWLARRLALELAGAAGCEVVGLDGDASLIAAAGAAHPEGSYRVVSYAEAIDRPARLDGPYDVAVCNFALLGQHLAPLLAALAGALAPGGALLVQTVHPWTACGAAPYRDGWREETFAGFGGGPWLPMPWYFRTLASWLAELDAAGLVVARCREPLEPTRGRPLSLLLTCRAGA